MSWILRLLEASSEAETPTNYIQWAGIATISAVVAPNVFINRGGVYKLSPNVFIMLIGESGLGKGFPIYVSKELVKLVGTTRIIAGRNTIQAILKDLATSETDPKSGVPKFKDARGYVVSGEFATLLQDDKAALPILTELYDTHYVGDWKNSTKNVGVDHLEKVNLTLFGGSTPEHFTNVVPDSDVKGGFVGRILTVYAEERSKVNPLSDTEAISNFPFAELAEHLKTISLVRGPFRYTPKAKKYWDEWYIDIRTRKIHDPTGAVNRLPDNVLKVAMCLSLSNDLDLLLHLENLEQSIEMCMTLTIESRRLTEGKGKSALGEQTKLVIHALYRHPEHTITKSKLLQMYYGQFDIYELDRIVQTLESADMIKCMHADGQWYLVMAPETVDNIKKFMER